jgi:hypothetical protein
MFNRIGFTIIGALLLVLFAALPMGLMMGRVVKARSKHSAVKTEATRRGI